MTGICQVCGTRQSKASMLGHLRMCFCVPQARTALLGSELFLLRAQAGDAVYWLDIAVKRDAKLKEVDRFLRRIWLECCGHMSEFHSTAYHKVNMSTTVGDAFRRIGDHLGYVYDFGSSTELVVSLLERTGGKIASAVQLLARNEPPVLLCDECNGPATAVCAECIYDGAGLCCAEHVKTHECGEEMLLPVVNSPRMGVCGYTGEA